MSSHHEQVRPVPQEAPRATPEQRKQLPERPTVDESINHIQGLLQAGNGYEERRSGLYQQIGTLKHSIEKDQNRDKAHTGGATPTMETYEGWVKAFEQYQKEPGHSVEELAYYEKSADMYRDIIRRMKDRKRLMGEMVHMPRSSSGEALAELNEKKPEAVRVFMLQKALETWNLSTDVRAYGEALLARERARDVHRGAQEAWLKQHAPEACALLEGRQAAWKENQAAVNEWQSFARTRGETGESLPALEERFREEYLELIVDDAQSAQVQQLREAEILSTKQELQAEKLSIEREAKELRDSTRTQREIDLREERDALLRAEQQVVQRWANISTKRDADLFLANLDSLTFYNNRPAGSVPAAFEAISSDDRMAKHVARYDLPYRSDDGRVGPISELVLRRFEKVSVGREYLTTYLDGCLAQSEKGAAGLKEARQMLLEGCLTSEPNRQNFPSNMEYFRATDAWDRYSVSPVPGPTSEDILGDASTRSALEKPFAYSTDPNEIAPLQAQVFAQLTADRVRRLIDRFADQADPAYSSIATALRVKYASIL